MSRALLKMCFVTCKSSARLLLVADGAAVRVGAMACGGARLVARDLRVRSNATGPDAELEMEAASGDARRTVVAEAAAKPLRGVKQQSRNTRKRSRATGRCRAGDGGNQRRRQKNSCRSRGGWKLQRSF